MDIEYIKQKFADYFRLDQKLEDGKKSEYTVGENAPIYERYRRLCSFIIPATVVWVIWWSYMFFTKDSFAVFNEKIGSFNKPLFLVSITMIFGALVAGATSEGGAAIAFPVLTLTMGVSPPIARDFSYLIQSVGMTSAAFSILFMGVKIERN